MPKPLTAEQFWAKVDRVGHDQCWEWRRCRHHTTGYGVLSWRNKHATAHRVAFELHSGQPIPKGLKVLHRCDNRPCCNPNHLFLGTQAENVRDMVSKGRNPNYIGEHNPRAKLTANDIISIRAGGYEGLSNCAVGEILGVSDVLISMVRRNKIWTHIQPNRKEPT